MSNCKPPEGQHCRRNYPTWRRCTKFGGEAECFAGSFVYRGEPRTKRDRINRLRERLNAAETVEQLRSMMQGLLDLLGDEL